MNAPAFPIRVAKVDPGDSALAQRLRREVDGDVLFDRASRGRYSTDASIYQIEPIGVVVPRTEEAVRAAIAIAADAGVPILPRGAGSSQCGQTVGAALVIDQSSSSSSLANIREYAEAGREIADNPGAGGGQALTGALFLGWLPP